MELTQAYFGDIDIAKSRRDDNGNFIVYGKVTGPGKDIDGHRCDPTWLQKSMPAWSEWGNIREMHQPVAAGVGLELADEDDNWYLSAKIVDEGAIKKVEEGVYKGFSIGVKGAGIYTDSFGQQWINRGLVAEVSLVDRPCLPDAVFDGMFVAKALGDTLHPVSPTGRVYSTDRDGNIIDAPSPLEVAKRVEKAASQVTAQEAHTEAGMAPQVDDVDTAPNPAGKDASPSQAGVEDHAHEHHHGNGIGHHSHQHTHPHTDGDHQRGDAGYTAKAASPDQPDHEDSGCGCCPNCMMTTKAVTADGEVDETPDINGAEHALQIIGQLIAYEADEMAKCGEFDETCDIALLLDAARCLRMFRTNEQMSDGGSPQDVFDRYMMAEADLFKAHRSFTAAQRKELASKGHALPDGSYPIPDTDALRRAAILARSGHGNVAAAKRLIAKRAKELGVPNPLAEKSDDTNKTIMTDPDITTMTIDPDVVKAAVAEAIGPIQEQLATAQADLAKVLATPVPTPVAMTVPSHMRGPRADNHAAMAEVTKYETLSKMVGIDPELAQYYRDKASEARAAVAGTN